MLNKLSTGVRSFGLGSTAQTAATSPQPQQLIGGQCCGAGCAGGESLQRTSSRSCGCPNTATTRRNTQSTPHKLPKTTSPQVSTSAAHSLASEVGVTERITNPVPASLEAFSFEHIIQWTNSSGMPTPPSMFRRTQLQGSGARLADETLRNQTPTAPMHAAVNLKKKGWQVL